MDNGVHLFKISTHAHSHIHTNNAFHIITAKRTNWRVFCRMSDNVDKYHKAKLFQKHLKFVDKSQNKGKNISNPTIAETAIALISCQPIISNLIIPLANGKHDGANWHDIITAVTWQALR